MNFNSNEWKELGEEIDRRVAALDKTNRAAKSAEETAHLRGQIAALLTLRRWPDDAALPTTEEIIFA